MAGKVLDLENILNPDTLASQISDTWSQWDGMRVKQKEIWQELRDYVFATDTSTTSNSTLNWKNKTTTPKLAQIRENLFANYWNALFPKRKWLDWKAADEASMEKAENIKNFAFWMTQNPRFTQEQTKLVYDYIDYGNSFCITDWVDERIATGASESDKSGYVGPVHRRISPYDIVFNPLAPSFEESPKIIRSVMTLGELKKFIEQQSADEQDREAMTGIYNEMMHVRSSVSTHNGSFSYKNKSLQVDGYGSFDGYLRSGYVEILTFYGDLYDTSSGSLLENYKIVVVDRSKIFLKKQNNSFLGKPRIHHTGWRTRPDNLWCMGPLENLVGLQYRLDHVENLKADAFDFMVAPVLKVRGWVEPFEWKPFGQVHVGDEGDVTPMPPDTNILQANLELQYLSSQMEEMAGAPKEALGFRTPGEKTAFEVQRLENAASRIFQIKAVKYEEDLLEPTLNSMLEEARLRHVNMPIVYNDPNFDAAVFQEITPEDIVGNGSIRPMGARHFTERAEIVQNLSNFFQSPMAQDPMVLNHISGLKLANMMEDLLNIKDFNIIEENVRIAEQADQQRVTREQQEALEIEAQTPAGIQENDFDIDDPEIEPEVEEEDIEQPLP